jgi:hypothetical protein
MRLFWLDRIDNPSASPSCSGRSRKHVLTNFHITVSGGMLNPALFDQVLSVTSVWSANLLHRLPVLLSDTRRDRRLPRILRPEGL